MVQKVNDKLSKLDLEIHGRSKFQKTWLYHLCDLPEPRVMEIITAGTHKNTWGNVFINSMFFTEGQNLNA